MKTEKQTIEKEKRIIEQMIRLYCRRKEKNKILCTECKELLLYAQQRLDRCSFGEKKPTCRQCPIHCYKPGMKEKIRLVMRFSGPRMMLYAPIEVLKHLFL